jgi:hypothetical protein
MKTLRELLLEKHQKAEPRLNAIREQVVAGLAPDGSAEAPVRPERRARDWQPGASHAPQVHAPPSLLSTINYQLSTLLRSLRWHLAGLSAAWLVVAALSIDSPPAPSHGMARSDAPSPRQLLAALRENQRQLRELIGVPAAEPAPEPQKPAPSPQSQIQPFSMAPA